jgi:DNA-binding NtrC family response regulator
MIHREAGAANAPFVAINLAAIPKDLVESALFGHEKGAFTGAVRQQIGKFELASGGTLFLDEIGDLRLDLQAKLLRAIQEGEIERVGGMHPIKTEFRLIAATNIDLERAVKDGTFRGDLYYRLNVIPVRMPPLRERLEDVPLLAERFFQLAVRENGLRPKPVDPDVYDRLRGHRWPGNVRELRNVCERMVIMGGDRLGAADVPEAIGPRAAPPPAPGAADLSRYGEVPLKELRDLVERDYILKKLEEHDWNITHAAQALGVERTNLHKKIKQHGLSRAGRGDPPDAAE